MWLARLGGNAGVAIGVLAGAGAALMGRRPATPPPETAT